MEEKWAYSLKSADKKKKKNQSLTKNTSLKAQHKPNRNSFDLPFKSKQVHRN